MVCLENMLKRRGIWYSCAQKCDKGGATILTHMMADKFIFLWSEIKNYLAEADADLIPSQAN